ncbi:MAG: nucleotidyltransferase domain-containing protein [Acidobacteriota bacterium]
MTARATVRLPALVDETLNAFVSGVRQRFGRRLVSIRLFGSYARGDATADSDFDCLVLLDRVDPADDRAITDLSADLVWQIGGVVISPLMRPGRPRSGRIRGELYFGRSRAPTIQSGRSLPRGGPP